MNGVEASDVAVCGRVGGLAPFVTQRVQAGQLRVAELQVEGSVCEAKGVQSLEDGEQFGVFVCRILQEGVSGVGEQSSRSVMGKHFGPRNS